MLVVQAAVVVIVGIKAATIVAVIIVAVDPNTAIACRILCITRTTRAGSLAKRACVKNTAGGQGYNNILNVQCNIFYLQSLLSYVESKLCQLPPSVGLNQ